MSRLLTPAQVAELRALNTLPREPGKVFTIQVDPARLPNWCAAFSRAVTRAPLAPAFRRPCSLENDGGDGQ